MIKFWWVNSLVWLLRLKIDYRPSNASCQLWWKMRKMIAQKKLVFSLQYHVSTFHIFHIFLEYSGLSKTKKFRIWLDMKSRELCSVHNKAKNSTIKSMIDFLQRQQVVFYNVTNLYFRFILIRCFMFAIFSIRIFLHNGFAGILIIIIINFCTMPLRLFI